MKLKTNKVPQRKPEKVMSEKELEIKLIERYNKLHPQPRTLEQQVKHKLDDDYTLPKKK